MDHALKNRMQEMEQRKSNWSKGKWIESTLDKVPLHQLVPNVEPEQASNDKKQEEEEEEECQCGICFEWMDQPDRAPTILFPCGHTFCKDCIQKLAKRNCPHCRRTIEQQAPNIELQKMIQFHKEQIAKMKRVKKEEADEPKQKQLTLEQLQIRKQVLLQELAHVEDEQHHVLEQQHLAQEFLNQLHSKQQTVAQQLQLLQQKQSQIQQDISTVTTQQMNLNKQQLQNKQQMEYIYSTLDYLQIQIQKYELMKVTKRQ